MSATITIPPELEEKISRRAAASGLSFDEYACKVLERDAAMSTLRELFAPVRDQIESSDTSDETLTEQIEEALSEVRSRRRG